MATVLVVEERFVSGFLCSALEQRGYRVICATADAARATLGRDSGTVDLLITNTPLVFADSAGLPLLYLAACPDEKVIEPFDRALALAKPFHPRQLFDCVRRLLG